MKILVLSDSHSGLRFMRQAIDRLKPDAVIHLGDYYDDGQAMAEQYHHIPFHQVPGNCDRYRSYAIRQETLCYHVCGVKLFMTHGHNHHVKSGLYALLKDARTAGAAAVLYGHTHVADCHMEPDGLWVLNPGAAGNASGSVGLIVTDGNRIVSCSILPNADPFTA